MTDIVDKATRSRMMSGIRGKNTNPELIVRSFLHKSRLRFSLHSKKLPGKPDIVLRKYQTVIFVQGCFWHMHLCRQFVWPKSREEFWREKLTKNAVRDMKNKRLLKKLGWNVLTIWECRIGEKALHRLVDRIKIRTNADISKNRIRRVL